MRPRADPRGAWRRCAALAALALGLAGGASGQMEQRPGAAHRNADPVRNAQPGTVPDFAGADGVRRGRDNAFITQIDAKLLIDTDRMADAELQAAALAAQRGRDRQLVEFARMLTAQLGPLQTALRRLADAKGVNLREGPALTARVALHRLEQADPADFDRRYRERLGREAYQRAVEDHRRATELAGDPDVRAFAQQTLPTLQALAARAAALAAASP